MRSWICLRRGGGPLLELQGRWGVRRDGEEVLKERDREREREREIFRKGEVREGLEEDWHGRNLKGQMVLRVLDGND